MSNATTTTSQEPERLIVTQARLIDQLIAALRNSNGALDSLLLQVDQMKGMFSDEDGTIGDAEDAGVDAMKEIDGLLPVLKAAAVNEQHALVVPVEEYRSLLETVTNGRELISEALTTHIYDIDEEIPEDDNYGQYLESSAPIIRAARVRLGLPASEVTL